MIGRLMWTVVFGSVYTSEISYTGRKKLIIYELWKTNKFISTKKKGYLIIY